MRNTQVRHRGPTSHNALLEKTSTFGVAYQPGKEDDAHAVASPYSLSTQIRMFVVLIIFITPTTSWCVTSKADR